MDDQLRNLRNGVADLKLDVALIGTVKTAKVDALVRAFDAFLTKYPSGREANRSVLQDWVVELSLKKQTVLIGAIRSPDTVHTLELKRITVWLRKCILKNADPLTGFQHAALDGLPLFEQADREFERLPLHAAHHILLAMQVIGMDHSDNAHCSTAWSWYCEAVAAQHLNQETPSQYEARMRDNPARVEESLS